MAKAIGGRTRVVLLLASAVLIAVGLIPAAPASATSNDQCVVKVTGVDKNDNFITSPIQCYATYANVLRSVGSAAVSDGVTPATVSPQVIEDDSILGTHYDANNFTGASFSVVGTLCSGGGLNLPSQWNDRISSTANGCNDIVHYQNANYGGSTFDSTGAGAVMPGYIDNQTSSIKYWA